MPNSRSADRFIACVYERSNAALRPLHYALRSAPSSCVLHFRPPQHPRAPRGSTRKLASRVTARHASDRRDISASRIEHCRTCVRVAPPFAKTDLHFQRCARHSISRSNSIILVLFYSVHERKNQTFTKTNYTKSLTH